METICDYEKFYNYFEYEDFLILMYEREIYHSENIRKIELMLSSIELTPEEMNQSISIIIEYNAEVEKQQKKNGFQIFRYRTGEIKTKGCWIDGKKEGVHVWFEKDGKVREKITWKNNRRCGTTKSFFPSGTLKSRRTFYKNNLSGKSTTFYENGNKKEIYNFVKGTICGNYKLFHHNGNIRIKGSVLGGEKHGTFCQYGINGNILEKHSFVRGKLHGKLIKYMAHVRNRIRFELNYWHGQKHGAEKVFFPDSRVAFECRYKMGKKDGFERRFTYDGNLIYKKKWKQGVEYESLMIQKYEMLLRKFYETKNMNIVNTIPKKFLESTCENESLLFRKSWTKKKIINALWENFNKQRKQENVSNEYDKVDVFGIDIESPVIGNDGGIYDLKSMEHLFEKKNNEYVNILYHYVNGILVPNFPRMENGNILSQYFDMNTLKTDTSIPNRENFLQKLTLFNNKK